MPYSTNQDLPANVKNVLPVEAQSIYRGAFNSAMSNGESEATARKIAWSAVKAKYRKAGDKWVKKMLSTPVHSQGAGLVRENLASSKKLKKK
jgi:cation transport regulator